ncbi:hypothetical protein BT93_L1422 [Corymbia citriodora subsp. variegata]|uniref:Uncharacterized protein n=1 Tax=Corymbia citriodora subsp. variegata TaxID=360336 RepID=A0A8T0CRM7_CORYI|nr:hypothetical protein BT93_L1422 [Corymbia citriodora subsp. variegata]
MRVPNKSSKGRAKYDGKCQLNFLVLLSALHLSQLHYQLHLSNLETERDTLSAQPRNIFATPSPPLRLRTCVLINMTSNSPRFPLLTPIPTPPSSPPLFPLRCLLPRSSSTRED